MPDRQVVAKELAEIFKIIAHPDRIRIIEELGQSEKDVNTLVEHLDLPGPRVSQHLSLMRANRIVEERREGRHHYYHLMQPEIANWIIEALSFVEGRASLISKNAISRARDLWTAPVENDVGDQFVKLLIWRIKMPHFAAGVIKFQNEVYPQKKELFEKLSKGQSPEALFITCSDSRIETAMITQTDPGELFICRNAGNIVPPHTNHTGGMTASIEFAVSALNVPHIVICGHTECGAMKGALDLGGLDSLPHVKEWLGYSKAAVAAVDGLEPADDEQRMQMLLERNVMLQLQHLKTHPSVAARLAKGDLKLHGWVYDIKSGDVQAYNDKTDSFESVDVHYAKEMAEIAKSSTCAA